jgi:DHA1 family bicyclomycin/chloramphenicol resistance-like MFS transporter
MPLNERLLIVLLVALAAFGPLSFSIYTPSMPDIGRNLLASDADVKLTLTTFLIGFSAGQIIFGPLSDRYGRRPVLLAGVAIYALMGLACALANSIDALIAIRLFHGIGVCSGQVISRAITRDTFGHHGSPKVMGWISLGINIAPAIAPILGGHLTGWFGWRSVFYVLAGFGALIFAIVFVYFRESNVHRGQSLGILGTLRQAGPMLRDRTFMGYALSMSAIFASMFAYVAGGPFVLMKMVGLTPQEFGYWILTSVAGFTVGSFIATRMIGRISPPRIVAIGLLVGVAGFAAMALPALMGVLNLYVIMLPYFIAATGYSMVMAPAMSGAVNRFPKLAGTASSLMGTMQMGCAALSTAIVTALSDGTQFPMIFTLGGCTVTGLIVSTWLLRPLRQAEVAPAMTAPVIPPGG